MTKKEKLKRKFVQRPESLKSFQIENILQSHGFKRVLTKGSHVKYKHDRLNIDLVIPVHNKDCKDFYKKQVAKILERNKI